VTFYLAHHKTKRLEPKSAQECADSFLTHQKALNISSSQIKTLTKHFKRFNADFGTRKIHEITNDEIFDWLASRKDEATGEPWSTKTRNSNRGSLVSLSLFAQKKLGAIPRGDETEFQKVGIAKAEHKDEVDIYTHDEMRQLLADAFEHDLDMIPVLVMGGFQGLRPAEIHGEGVDRPPLKWSAFLWHDQRIEIRGQKIRSKQNRDLPMLAATRAWLAPFEKLEGRVWLHAQAHSKKLIALRAHSKVRSVGNGFRHSYASYRVRHLKSDLPQLAAEMGNSPNQIISSYKRNVTDAQADTWFSIMPPAGYAERVRVFLELRQASVAKVE
jgi:integrase